MRAGVAAAAHRANGADGAFREPGAHGSYYEYCVLAGRLRVAGQALPTTPLQCQALPHLVIGEAWHVRAQAGAWH